MVDQRCAADRHRPIRLGDDLHDNHAADTGDSADERQHNGFVLDVGTDYDDRELDTGDDRHLGATGDGIGHDHDHHGDCSDSLQLVVAVVLRREHDEVVAMDHFVHDTLGQIGRTTAGDRCEDV